MRALTVVKNEYKHDPVTIKAAIAIEKRVRLVSTERRTWSLYTFTDRVDVWVTSTAIVAGRWAETTSAFIRRALA